MPTPLPTTTVSRRHSVCRGRCHTNPLPVRRRVPWGEGVKWNILSAVYRPSVAWKQWWWGGVWATLSLRLLFIQIPSSASERAIAGEKSPEPPPWAPGKAQMSPAPVPLVLGRRDAVPAPPTPCLAIAPSPGHPPGPPRHAEKSALPQLWLFSVPGPPLWMPPKR